MGNKLPERDNNSDYSSPSLCLANAYRQLARLGLILVQYLGHAGHVLCHQNIYQRRIAERSGTLDVPWSFMAEKQVRGSCPKPTMADKAPLLSGGVPGVRLDASAGIENRWVSHRCHAWASFSSCLLVFPILYVHTFPSTGTTFHSWLTSNNPRSSQTRRFIRVHFRWSTIDQKDQIQHILGMVAINYMGHDETRACNPYISFRTL